MPAHLYVHIPFCAEKCSYCAFVTHIGGDRLIEPYLRAVASEARARAAEQAGYPLRSVYFGGGTPSRVPPVGIRALLDCFQELWGLDSECEVTMEGHPLSLDRLSLKGFRAAGVTRLSFGAESLDATELRALGRSHAPTAAGAVVRDARQTGFSSVNVDVIYGTPLQTLDSWREGLARLTGLDADHLSLYPLAIEPKTVFARRQREGSLRVPEAEAVVEMYHVACETLAEYGYVHYEVSNWARPGHECRHNLNCWEGGEYYGIGAGAHSYVKPFRASNIERTRRYIEGVEGGQSPTESRETVSPQDEIRERVWLRLRLLQSGLDVETLKGSATPDHVAAITASADSLVAAGLLISTGGSLRLPEGAVPVANEIWERMSV